MAAGRDYLPLLFDENIESAVATKVRGKKVTVLLAGHGGTGKSTLVNTLLLKKECKTGLSADAVTTDLKKVYIALPLKDGGECTVEIIDTPGCSGNKEDDAKIAEALKGIPSFDLLLVCIDFSANGSRYSVDSHYRPLKFLRKTLGDECMKKKTVIVLTKANKIFDAPDSEPMRCDSVSARSVKELFEGWKKKSEQELSSRKNVEPLKKIPMFVAGRATFNGSRRLERFSNVDGTSNWYDHLWDGIAGYTNTAMTPIMYTCLADARRTTKVPLPVPSRGVARRIAQFVMTSSPAEISVPARTLIGVGAVTAAVGGPVGAALGGGMMAVGGAVLVAGKLLSMLDD